LIDGDIISIIPNDIDIIAAIIIISLFSIVEDGIYLKLNAHIIPNKRYLINLFFIYYYIENKLFLILINGY